MIEDIFKFLQSTPWWIYLVFCYLIYVGFIATRKQLLSIPTTYLVALVFFFFSIKTLGSFGAITKELIYTWLASIATGSCIIFLTFINKTIIIDKRKNLVQLPGSYSTIATSIFFFLSHYIIHIIKVTNNNLIQQPYFPLLSIFIATLPLGIFIGRALLILKKYFEGPFGNLDERDDS